MRDPESSWCSSKGVFNLHCTHYMLYHTSAMHEINIIMLIETGIGIKAIGKK